MSEMFDIEMNGYPRDEDNILPLDIQIKAELKQKIGFEIGFDQAFYKLPLPDRADSAIENGYNNCKTQVNHQSIDKYIKKWMQIRFQAYLRNRLISNDVTPQIIRALDNAKCPITGVNFTYGTLELSDWSVERLCNESAYAYGNICLVSTQANLARGALSYEQICEVADSHELFKGLPPQAWINYKNLARGPNFWAGKTRGIIPLSIPFYEFPIYVSPSQYLQEVAYTKVSSSVKRIEETANILLKNLTSSQISKTKLIKFLTKVERHFKKGHNRHQTFSNDSCFESFLDWYESSNLGLHQYMIFLAVSKKVKLNLPNDTIIEMGNPTQDWSVNTDGYLR